MTTDMRNLPHLLMTFWFPVFHFICRYKQSKQTLRAPINFCTRRNFWQCGKHTGLVAFNRAGIGTNAKCMAGKCYIFQNIPHMMVTIKVYKKLRVSNIKFCRHLSSNRCYWTVALRLLCCLAMEAVVVIPYGTSPIILGMGQWENTLLCNRGPFAVTITQTIAELVRVTS